MKVTLRNGWFGPDGHYRGPGEHELPEDFREALPPSAEAEEKKSGKTDKKVDL